MAEFASGKGQPVPTETVVSSISKLAGLDATALEEATAERQRAFIRERYGASAAGRAAGCCDDGAAGCCDDVAGPTPMPAGAAPKDFGRRHKFAVLAEEERSPDGRTGIERGDSRLRSLRLTYRLTDWIGGAERVNVCAPLTDADVTCYSLEVPNMHKSWAIWPYSATQHLQRSYSSF